MADDDVSIAVKFSLLQIGNSDTVSWFREAYTYNVNDNYCFSDCVADVHGKKFSCSDAARNYVFPRLLRVARLVYDADASIVIKGHNNRVDVRPLSLLDKYTSITYSYCSGGEKVVTESIVKALTTPIFGIHPDVVDELRTNTLLPDTSAFLFLKKLKHGEIPIYFTRITTEQLAGISLHAVDGMHVYELYVQWVQSHNNSTTLCFDSFIQQAMSAKSTPFLVAGYSEKETKSLLFLKPAMKEVAIVTNEGIAMWESVKARLPRN
jgi:hypothetical protein